MLGMFGERQQELLRSLHKCKAGMTIDELASGLEITRTAVKQHLDALERAGYIKKGPLRLTKGRPSRAFQLAGRGIDLFPKQYSWFSGLLLQAIKAERGSDGLTQYMRELAASFVHTLAPRVQAKQGQERTEAIAKIMNELAFEAEVTKNHSSAAPLPIIEAHNCVYHHLAAEFPEVCQFDIELLEKLAGTEVDHQECIIRGGNVCRFAFRQQTKK